MSSPQAPDPSRQAPLYGEYATPEELAALRGASVAPPPAASPPAATPPAASPSVSRGRRPIEPATGARRFDRPVTIALLVFGVLSLLQFSPLFLDFERALEQATAGGPMADADFGELTAISGRVLFGVLLLLLVLAGVLAFRALRAGRVAFWIPLTAGITGALAVIVVFVVVLTQTPGAIPAVT